MTKKAVASAVAVLVSMGCPLLAFAQALPMASSQALPMASGQPLPMASASAQSGVQAGATTQGGVQASGAAQGGVQAPSTPLPVVQVGVGGDPAKLPPPSSGHDAQPTPPAPMAGVGGV